MAQSMLVTHIPDFTILQDSQTLGPSVAVERPWALKYQSKMVQTHQKLSHDSLDTLISPIKPQFLQLLLIQRFNFFKREIDK